MEYKGYNKEPLKIKLSTFIVFLIFLIAILGIISFLYIKHKNDLVINNNIDVVESKTDNSIVLNDDEISYNDDLQPSYLVQFGDVYYYINNQGYIIFDVVDTNTVLPTIDGFETNFENSKNIERLDDDDIKKLDEINLIMEVAKEQNIYNLISKIIIEDGKYILFSENQKKYIYFGDATDIKTKITYAKNIMEKEKVSGIIYLNGDLQNGFKPYFREDANAEKVTDEISLNDSNEYTGIGVYLKLNDNNQVTILDVIKNSPAEKEGLLKNDIILKVGDILINGQNEYDVAKLIKEKVGSNIKIKVLRNNEELEFNITKELITIPTNN